MPVLYCAEWVLPISAPPVSDAAIVVKDDLLVAVGKRSELSKKFPDAATQNFGNAASIPGLINAHSHLELTAMRGFLDREEAQFLSWLTKLTKARLEMMSADDLYISAAWGACEAVRAGVTAVADASDSAGVVLNAVRDVGLRGTIFQESFGPDPRLARQNFEKLKEKVASLRELATSLVGIGVSPHAPYTVCAAQLEMVADFAISEKLPLMMHAAESAAEDSFVREGRGPFAEGLRSRAIEWRATGSSTIQYLRRLGI
ncbi:MAG TPA: amidohydrolase family protein, partial [Pyrinomonadaceae bacterium]|nr:amidohydrolase family protein [Pyrinomonadaceae bacterium]